MNLDCIHHVAILVSDYQAALAFYRDKLGLPLLRDVDRPAQGDPDSHPGAFPGGTGDFRKA